MATEVRPPQAELKDSLIPDNEKKQEVKISEIKSFKDLWMWFIKDPISRWPLLFFLLTFALIIVWLIIYLASGNEGYVIAGIAGSITGIYGFYHFRLLMALKEQVENFMKLNVKFKQENTAVLKDVNRLQFASTQLRTMEDTLRQSTEKQKQNLHVLTQLNQNLTAVGGVNSDSMRKIQDMSKTVVSKWKEQMIKHERGMLFAVYEQMEFKDNQSGLDENEYKEFFQLIPPKYQERFKKLGTFKELAGDDNVLDLDEFKAILDKICVAEIEE